MKLCWLDVLGESTLCCKIWETKGGIWEEHESLQHETGVWILRFVVVNLCNQGARFSPFVLVCCQAEGPADNDEEESEKSVSEVNDEDDEDDASGEVYFARFL